MLLLSSIGGDTFARGDAAVYGSVAVCARACIYRDSLPCHLFASGRIYSGRQAAGIETSRKSP